jgi:hypothetical protein
VNGWVDGEEGVNGWVDGEEGVTELGRWGGGGE